MKDDIVLNHNIKSGNLKMKLCGVIDEKLNLSSKEHHIWFCHWLVIGIHKINVFEFHVLQKEHNNEPIFLNLKSIMLRYKIVACTKKNITLVSSENMCGKI